METPPNSPSPLNNEVFASFSKMNDAKNGLVCIPCLLNQFSPEELLKFMDQQGINLPSTTQTRVGMMEKIFNYYASEKSLQERLKSERNTRIQQLGQDICDFPGFSCDITHFDFITKIELQNIFGNYAADIGITVFKAPENNEFGMDLYLTKKDPLLKTESVFIATGSDIESRYKDIFYNLGRTAEVSDWQILVTTPLGAYEIGLKQLKADMKKLGVWLYIIDPKQQQIFGVTKGPKSKRKNEITQEKFIRDLPTQPIRAPSQVKKLSNYYFSEKKSYKPKDVELFYIPDGSHSHPAPIGGGDPSVSQKYRAIFRSFIFMTKESGLSFSSYSSEIYKVDDMMISGFISAIDSFVQELSGSGSLKEIDYQNFKITALVGEYVKLVLITSDSAGDELRERLDFFLRYIEETYLPELQHFIKTGDQSGIPQEKFIDLAKKYLLI
ncbi:MAG: hypothetical protein ACTSVZ_12445 [Promethearchaeota archaeon]